jgi:hypothetical protein
MYVHTYMLMYICTYIHTYKRTYICTHVRTYMLTYICTYIRPYTHIYIYIYTYIQTYIRTCEHVYIHTYIHTYINFVNSKDLSNYSCTRKKSQIYNTQHNKHKTSIYSQHRNSTNPIPKRINVKYK